jgi:hypothetical protein
VSRTVNEVEAESTSKCTAKKLPNRLGILEVVTGRDCPPGAESQSIYNIKFTAASSCVGSYLFKL